MPKVPQSEPNGAIPKLPAPKSLAAEQGPRKAIGLHKDAPTTGFEAFEDGQDRAGASAARVTIDRIKNASKMLEPIHVVVLPPTEERGRTEGANADRLIKRYGHYLRYAVEWGEWLLWESGRWMRDTGTISIQRFAKDVVKSLWADVAAAENHLQKPMAAFAAKSNSARMIANMIALARSHAGIAVNVDKLDTNPRLLKVANGTLDLEAGRLRDDWQTDYLTKLCPTAYDPAAKCPRWERFLGETFAGDGALIGYVQRLLGYCLTGDVREQILPILWGTGSNGKSTLVNAIANVVGPDYAGTPPRQLFIASKFDRHPAELMALQGKRLMMAQETEAGAKLNEALIKNLTGGDKITARPMYGNFSTFDPTHKLLLSTNHKPEVRGSNYAMWRRLKLIPFEVTFEGDRVDGELEGKLKAEAQGILAWMVRGCTEWLKGGLKEPESVVMATKGYADEQDDVGRFLTEFCERGEGYEIGAKELYEAFKEAAPESEMTQAAFGRELAGRGVERGKTTRGAHKNRTVYKGLRVVSAVQSLDAVKLADAFSRNRTR